ncbi:MAG: DnaA regulatory inactivator Hda [Burkholderiales bacterium]
MKQLILDLSLRAEPNLDNFVAGRNAEALQALRELVTGGLREPVVYLFGAPGSGRTHLLRAVVGSYAQGRARYVAADPGNSLPDPLPELVAWDDVNQLDEAGQAHLFGLQIRLRESGGVLLCSGDVAPARLALRADVVTRLAAGVAYPLHVLADEDKAEAVARHAELRGFRLGRDVIGYLLRRHARDLPALIGMLAALDRYSLETKRPITLPLLRELLAEPDS